MRRIRYPRGAARFLRIGRILRVNMRLAGVPPVLLLLE